MIEIIVLYWLCRKNWRAALDRGRRPVGFCILTAALWFYMETGGLVIGLMAGFGFAAYILAIVFALTGSSISRAFVVNLKQGNYIPKPEIQPPLESPAQVTITRRESSGLYSFGAWDIVLNGEGKGSIEDGGLVTAETCQPYNVLTAKNSKGAFAPPIEFPAESGRTLEVRFRGGRFEEA